MALATGLVTHFASSVTKYQVTNYGLGGTCETHIDPYGYLEGFKLTDVNSHLIETGPKTFCALPFFQLYHKSYGSLRQAYCLATSSPCPTYEYAENLSFFLEF